MSKQTAFRLNSLDLTILDEVRRREAFVNRTEAFRHVLRYWAKVKGLALSVKGVKGR